MSKNKETEVKAQRPVNRTPAIIALAVVVLLIIGLLSVGPLLDGVVKHSLVRAVNTGGADTIHIGSMSYGLLSNAVVVRDIVFSTRDTTPSGIRLVRVSSAQAEIAGVHLLRLLFGSMSASKVMLGGVKCEIDLDTSVVSAVAAGPESEKVGSRDSVFIEELAAALPERFSPLHIGVFAIRNADVVRRVEGKTEDSVSAIVVDVRDIAVDPEELRKGGKIWSRAEFSTGAITTSMLGPVYVVKFDSLRFSSATSLLRLSSLTLQPTVSDEQFFAGLRYRMVRFRVKIPEMEFRRFRIEDYLRSNLLSTGAVVLNNPEFDMLLNKRLPTDPTAPPPKMPNQFFDSLTVAMQLDSLQFRNARIVYSELFPYSDKPAVLPFTFVHFDVTGIRHIPGRQLDPRPVSIRAAGKLADAGMLRLQMEIPLDVQHLRFTCRGTLDAMDPKALNSFLVVSDRIRIASGKVDNADFSFSASEGRSAGSLNVEYTGLAIAVLDEETGSEKGLMPKLKTFIANAFALRANNPPSDKKTGTISYVQKPDDAFMDVVWLSVRSGLQDLIGF